MLSRRIQLHDHNVVSVGVVRRSEGSDAIRDGVRQGALNRCGNIDISMHVDREVAARQPWIQRVDSLDQVYGLRQVLCGGRAQKNSDRHKWAEKSHLERLEQAKVQEFPVLCGPI